MYQHLYAVACLLSAQTSDLKIVTVEMDEDIELHYPNLTVYVQVKTRNRLLRCSDFNGALERFAVLRQEHAEGRRAGEAQFVIVSNQAPSTATKQALDLSGSNYVSFKWPGGHFGAQTRQLPDPWPDITSAVHSCIEASEKLTLRTISSETLVWKLATHVALASSGTEPYTDHQFRSKDLPTLFEQIARQMHDFPEPLLYYRPLQDEPPIESTAHVRIICGFSGAGKTSWAAQAVAHSCFNIRPAP